MQYSKLSLISHSVESNAVVVTMQNVTVIVLFMGYVPCGADVGDKFQDPDKVHRFSVP